MSQPSVPVSWRERGRVLADRLPTRWIITGGTAGLLGLSALFGGLEAAPVQAAPVLAAGESHAGSELTVTVDNALLIDALPEQYLSPTTGNRLLVVRATVENTTTEPRRLSPVEVDSIGVDGVPGVPHTEPPLRILVIDDGSGEVVVQPGVPVELAYVWEIGAAALSAGDTVTVDLLDRVYISEGRLTHGGLYADPVVAATVSVLLDDVGAGASE